MQTELGVDGEEEEEEEEEEDVPAGHRIHFKWFFELAYVPTGQVLHGLSDGPRIETEGEDELKEGERQIHSVSGAAAAVLKPCRG